jgi:hypothetical protein
MSVMIIKLADQVLKMQADIDSKKAFVNTAKKLEKDIMIQKQLKVISGLSQEMLYLNQSERLIDPAVLDMVKSTSAENYLSIPITPDSSKTQVIEPTPLANTMNDTIEIQKALVVVESFKEKGIISSRQIVQADLAKHIETEDTTSDIISEKSSELEIISENILPKAIESDTPLSDKSFQYEDDFESDDESSSKLPIIPASPPPTSAAAALGCRRVDPPNTRSARA